MTDKKIIWQHFANPFETKIEPRLGFIDPSAIEKEMDESDNLAMLEEDELNKKDFLEGIITQHGVIGINESYNPYDFWVGHCSFKITDHIEHIIENSEGVEYLKVLSPYRFKIAVARYFSQHNLRGKVLKNIEMRIFQFLDCVS
jgi:hypothetical protein